MTTTTLNRPSPAGLALLPVRLVAGWMFLSAFHRRVFLDPDKLDPEALGYVGRKFSQFMPGAIMGVDDMIRALLDRPDALFIFMLFFTIIEGLVGLALILGIGTRISAFGALALSGGILFGSGWLGPTCLDEWQIGAVGVATGAAMLLGGGGALSLDAWIARRFPEFASKRVVRLMADPHPTVHPGLAGGLAVGALALALITNQVFHGGVYGTLHNDSVRPEVSILETAIEPDGALRLTLERNKGPETYGAFLVALRIVDDAGEVLRAYSSSELAATDPDDIDNRWLVSVAPSAHGLVVPLGSRATVRLPTTDAAPLPAGSHRVVLEDVSGVTWQGALELR